MAMLEASKGGCYFCQQDDDREELLFSEEWDTHVHRSCVINQFKKGNPEADTLIEELQIVY